MSEITVSALFDQTQYYSGENFLCYEAVSATDLFVKFYVRCYDFIEYQLRMCQS